MVFKFRKVAPLALVLSAILSPAANADFYSMDGMDYGNGVMTTTQEYSGSRASIPTKTIEIQTGIPSGAIVPFLGNCPKGSRVFKELAGRVVVGAGELDDGTLRHRYRLGETGGTQRHKLTIEEMPKHSHGVQTEPDGGGGSGSVATGPRKPVKNWPTEPAGGDGYHENRMPYMAMNWCKFD
ncbi:hypothetical protein DZF79_15730 [Vibrio parahaemolyticus]|nr:hypothetical protein [Vibrio parahaemolyticus]